MKALKILLSTAILILGLMSYEWKTLPVDGTEFKQPAGQRTFVIPAHPNVAPVIPKGVRTLLLTEDDHGTEFLPEVPLQADFSEEDALQVRAGNSLIPSVPSKADFFDHF